MKTIIIVGCLIAADALVAFATGGVKMKISSPAFQEGGTIPEKFSKNGQNVSPELRIEGAPAEAKSLALIVDDPDAPSDSLLTGWFGTLIQKQRKSRRTACRKARSRERMIIRILATAARSHLPAHIVIISKYLPWIGR